MAQHLEQDLSGPATLGDVLYADKSKCPVSEKDWVRLVESIAAGDQLALHALYERAHRAVFTLIMRITGIREITEELTLEVFHDVWRRASGYDAGNGTVLGWIMNQARFRAMDRLGIERLMKRVNHHASEPLAAAAGNSRKSEAMQRMLTALTVDERQAIETAFFSELTYAEAAVRLNQPLGAVKTRIRSGLHKLRQAMAAEAGKP